MHFKDKMAYKTNKYIHCPDPATNHFEKSAFTISKDHVWT